MIESLDHVNIVVDDLEGMTAFYRDVLGLGVRRRATIRGHWIEAVAGLDGVEADVVYLDVPGAAGVELIRYRSPGRARPEGLEHPNAGGIRHVAFRVRDLDATVRRLEEAGSPLLSRPQRVPDEQVSYSGGKRLVYCRDPEGNLLELCAFGSRG